MVSRIRLAASANGSLQLYKYRYRRVPCSEILQLGRPQLRGKAALVAGSNAVRSVRLGRQRVRPVVRPQHHDALLADAYQESADDRRAPASALQRIAAAPA